KLGLDSKYLASRASKFAHFAQVGAGDYRAGIANVGSLGTNLFVVLIGEQIRPGRVHAALHGGGAPGKDEDNVLAELGQLALVAGAEALAHAYQQEQRSHAPSNTEHGEERAQLVSPQVAEDLNENV